MVRQYWRSRSATARSSSDSNSNSSNTNTNTNTNSGSSGEGYPERGSKRKALASAEGERSRKRRSLSPSPDSPHQRNPPAGTTRRRSTTSPRHSPPRNQKATTSTAGRKRSRAPEDDGTVFDSSQSPSPKRLKTQVGVSAGKETAVQGDTPESTVTRVSKSDLKEGGEKEKKGREKEKKGGEKEKKGGEKEKKGGEKEKEGGEKEKEVESAPTCQAPPSSNLEILPDYEDEEPDAVPLTLKGQVLSVDLDMDDADKESSPSPEDNAAMFSMSQQMPVEADDRVTSQSQQQVAEGEQGVSVAWHILENLPKDPYDTDEMDLVYTYTAPVSNIHDPDSILDTAVSFEAVRFVPKPASKKAKSKRDKTDALNELIAGAIAGASKTSEDNTTVDLEPLTTSFTEVTTPITSFAETDASITASFTGINSTPTTSFTEVASTPITSSNELDTLITTSEVDIQTTSVADIETSHVTTVDSESPVITSTEVEDSVITAIDVETPIITSQSFSKENDVQELVSAQPAEPHHHLEKHLPHTTNIQASSSPTFLLATSRADAILVIPSAPKPPTFTDQEIADMMAAYEGPSQEDIDILSIINDMDNQMLDDDPQTFYAKQKNIREQLRRDREDDARIARDWTTTRHKVTADRMLLDEAPAPQQPTLISDIADDELDQLYTEHILADSAEEINAEQERFQREDANWKACWPHPSTFNSAHWKQESQTFRANEDHARNVQERIYWSNRRIQADCYVRAEYGSGKDCRPHIRVALLDWQKSLELAAQKAADDSVTEGQAPAVQPPDAQTKLRAKLAPFITQLPQELDDKVTKILNITQAGKEVAKSVDGVVLQRKDIATILHAANYRSGAPEGWLNDEIVNSFFSALANALNEKAGHAKGKVPPYSAYATAWFTAVTGSGKSIKNIERWSRRKGIKGEKLLQCKRIFFPMNPGNHWTLMIISPELRTIEYFDSLDMGESPSPRKSDRPIKLARQWLQMELGEQYVAEEWTNVDRRSSIQNNGSDCGMFTCLNGLASALDIENPGNEFGPNQIPYARRALISMLDLGGFSNHFEL